MLEAVSARGSAVTRWRAMIAALEREPFEAPLLQSLRASVRGRRRRASEEIASLERIVGFADARLNEVFRFVIGPLLMWDVHCALALLRWRDAGGRAPARLARHPRRGRGPREPRGVRLRAPRLRLARADARSRCSRLGRSVTRSSRPSAASPTTCASPRPGALWSSRARTCRARARCSGPSARTPSSPRRGRRRARRRCASGPLRVATSMRISDSLEQGVSHFYAELQRLKGVIDLAHEPGPAAGPLPARRDPARHELARAHHRRVRGRARAALAGRARRRLDARPGHHRARERAPGARRERSLRGASRRATR